LLDAWKRVGTGVAADSLAEIVMLVVVVETRGAGEITGAGVGA
jgi:hypothetical protein